MLKDAPPNTDRAQTVNKQITRLLELISIVDGLERNIPAYDTMHAARSAAMRAELKRARAELATLREFLKNQD